MFCLVQSAVVQASSKSSKSNTCDDDDVGLVSHVPFMIIGYKMLSYRRETALQGAL